MLQTTCIGRGTHGMMLKPIYSENVLLFFFFKWELVRTCQVCIDVCDPTEGDFPSFPVPVVPGQEMR